MIDLKGAPQETLLVVGLLGGIGSGKSTVARELGRLGALVLDADALAREVTALPEVREEISRQFGPAVLDPDGSVNRARLADRVFADEASRRALNAIIHPRVRQRIRRALERAGHENPTPVVVLDVPLLLESELNALVTCRIFVDTPEATRCERLRRERGWDPQELQRREATQAPLNEKRGRASYVLCNHGSLSELRREVEALWRRLTRRGRPTPSGEVPTPSPPLSEGPRPEGPRT
ncbi:MAG: dephospho-CoA kinase [Planctomycetota bacterium]